MSEENKINDALSIPLNNIQNNNADQDINKNQNKNKEINENAFLSFKTGLENVSKRIIYENHELNKNIMYLSIIKLNHIKKYIILGDVAKNGNV